MLPHSNKIKNMLIVISPSKKLDFTSKIKTNNQSIPQFLEDAKILINEVRKLSLEEIADFMKISTALAQLNFERFHSWHLPFDSENAKPALYAFSGNVYAALDAATLSPDDLDFAQSSLRILSGLYGILRPLDLMQAYRLEMGKKLQNPSGNSLYSFWQKKITKTINQELLENEHEVLINLASKEYFKAIRTKELCKPVITPVFKELKNDTYKVIVSYAKRARGLMARFIIKNKITNYQDLLAFDYDNYSYSEPLSNEKEMVFVR